MNRELGIFERAQVIADRYSPFHIVGILRIKGAPLPHILRRAFGELQKRHPFLSTCLVQENGRHYFATLIDPALPLHIMPRWNDEHWRQVVESELSIRIDASAGPLFRCTYLYDENHKCAEIIFALSHIIADAASTSQLMHELMTICASLSDEMPVPVSELLPALPVETRFPREFRGWRLTLHIMKYALGQVAEEISYRIRTIGKRTPPFHRNASHGNILPVQFPSELFEPFARRARQEGMTLNSALNAALLLAVNRHLYNGDKLPMRTFSFADMRPYVEPPLPAENLGLYISMMRYTVNVDGSGDFWTLARDLHKKIYKSLKTGDKFAASAMSESLLKVLTTFDSFRVCASALNFNRVVPVQTSYGNIKIYAVHGFVSAYTFGPEMASQAHLFNDRLFWDFVYLEEDMDHFTANAIVEEVRGILKSATA